MSAAQLAYTVLVENESGVRARWRTNVDRIHRARHRWARAWPPTCRRPATSSSCTTCTGRPRAIICMPARDLGRHAAGARRAVRRGLHLAARAAGCRGGRARRRRPARRREARARPGSICRPIRRAWCGSCTRPSPRRARTCSTRRSAAARTARPRGKLAIWVGGEQGGVRPAQAGARRDRRPGRYIGPIGAGSVAKLVHNWPATRSSARSPRSSRWA